MDTGISTSTLIFAFGLTLFAGLSTGIGAAIAFFAKKTNTKLLAISLGFSAGVMIYVSMIEIFQKARISLVQELGEQYGYYYTVAAFFAGVLLTAIIDKLVPSGSNPHEQRSLIDIENVQHSSQK